MKTLFLAAVVAGAISVAVAQGTPADSGARQSDKSAPSSPASPSAKSAPSDAAIANMQAHMKSMQELMDKLAQTKDPAERSRLLAQHRQAMHDQLASMQHMFGKDGGMMGQGMMGGDMMKCSQMMQGRMDLMSGMMDQMMRHEEAAR